VLKKTNCHNAVILNSFKNKVFYVGAGLVTLNVSLPNKRILIWNILRDIQRLGFNDILHDELCDKICKSHVLHQYNIVKCRWE